MLDTTTAPVADRVIAEARSYGELVAALKLRCRQLGQPYDVIDEVAGLPARYVAKVFAPVPIKGLGRISLGPILGALGVKLIVVEDAALLARISRHSIWRRDAHGRMLTRKKHEWRPLRGNSAWGNMMTARRLAMLSAQKRSRIAKRAAQARWRKAAPRKVADTSPPDRLARGRPSKSPGIARRQPGG